MDSNSSNSFDDLGETWADERAELRREFEHDEPRRNFFQFSCSDRMCGATDCRRCHPEGNGEGSGEDNQNGEE